MGLFVDAVATKAVVGLGFQAALLLVPLECLALSHGFAPARS